MLFLTGRRVFNSNYRRNLFRDFSTGSNNFRKGLGDRSLGILALLVSVPAVRFTNFLYWSLNYNPYYYSVGGLDLEASQIQQS